MLAVRRFEVPLKSIYSISSGLRGSSVIGSKPRIEDLFKRHIFPQKRNCFS